MIMNKKLPPDAFAYYFSLGPGRSYRAVADHFNVSKTSVSNLAERDNWQQKILDLEAKAKDSLEKKMSESIEEMAERHLKMCQVVQRKALEALRSMPLTTAVEAARALDASIKTERLVRGEPTDRATLDVEEIIRREYERWMVSTGEEEKDGNGSSGKATE